MDVLLQIVLGGSSIVTASAAIGVARWARTAAAEAGAAHRILTGEDEVESDDGLVGRVDELEEEKADEDDLEEVIEDARVVAEREVAHLRRELPDDVLTDGGRDDEHA